MFNFACKDTNNSQTTNYFWEFLYSLKWIFDHVVTPCLAPCDTVLRVKPLGASALCDIVVSPWMLFL